MATWIIAAVIAVAVIFAIRSRRNSDCGCGGGKNCETKHNK